MKLLEVRVERLRGIADGAYSIADASGNLSAQRQPRLVAEANRSGLRVSMQCIVKEDKEGEE